MTSPSLLGLAFTSPGVTVLAIDRQIFKVHLYQTGQLATLQLFVNSEDTRQTIILVSSIFDLKQIQDTKNIHSFILFEDVAVMKNIEGIHILDIEEDEAAISGYRRIGITATKLNAALRELKGPFTLTEEAISFEQELTSEITFRALVADIVKKLSTLKDAEKVTTDFLEYVCKYTVGLLAKRSWTTKVRKPFLAQGISVETLVELEKWLDTAAARALRKSYYSIVEENLSLENTAKKWNPNLADIKYIIELIGAEKGQKYTKKTK